MSDRLSPNAFRRRFLKRLEKSSEDWPITLCEVLAAGPWHVEKWGEQWAVVHDAGGEPGAEGEPFVRHEVAFIYRSCPSVCHGMI
jgi:hypothetical protein